MLKNYTKVKVEGNGTKRYFNDKEELHRLDGPAVEYSDRSKHWLIKGKLYRNIDPAIEYINGSKYWFFNNKRHRIGGSYDFHNDSCYIQGREYAKQEYYNEVWDI